MEVGDIKYNQCVVEHAMRPKNRGTMKKYDAMGKGGSPCGDLMEFYFKIDKKKMKGKEVEFIKDIKFETMGCAAAIATASATTEMIKGKTLEEAETLTSEQVIGKIGGLPDVKLHCCDLTVSALKAAISDYRLKKK